MLQHVSIESFIAAFKRGNNVEDADADKIKAMIGEMNAAMKGIYRGILCMSMGKTSVTFYREGVALANAMADHVTELYDADDNDEGMWEALGLGGDDDVDYAGSYVEGLCSAIEAL